MVQGPRVQAHPAGIIINTVLAHCAGTGADAGDSDKMAVRMGQEGTVASRAAQLHRGLRTEAQGSWVLAVPAASGACVWVVTLLRAPSWSYREQDGK